MCRVHIEPGKPGKPGKPRKPGNKSSLQKVRENLE